MAGTIGDATVLDIIGFARKRLGPAVAHEHGHLAQLLLGALDRLLVTGVLARHLRGLHVAVLAATIKVSPAKLQALAESWQIAMSKATYDAPGVAAWLRDQGATLEDDAYTSPALPAPVVARRWTVYRAPG